MADLTAYRIDVTDGNGCCHVAEVSLHCNRCRERPVATTDAGYPFTETLRGAEITLASLVEVAERHEAKAHGTEGPS